MREVKLSTKHHIVIARRCVPGFGYLIFSFLSHATSSLPSLHNCANPTLLPGR